MKVNLGTRSLKRSKNRNKRATENYILKFLTVSSVSSDSIVKESLMTLSTRLWKLPKSTSQKLNIYNILLAHLTQRVRWAIVTTERPSSVHPSVNFSHFNQLLWNHWANLNQILVEWSLNGPLPKLCPVIPTSNQDGCQAKNRNFFNCPLLL